MTTTTATGTSASNPVSLTSLTGNVADSANTLAGSEQTFMALLTAQLKNQDPLSPMDSTQFTQQLVQMTSVQQQIYGNQLLENLVAQGGGSLTNAVNLIGRQVTAQGDTTALSNGSANWAYNLPSAAHDATLEVLDSSGREVWSGPAETAAGSHAFAWDGKNSSGASQPNGDYRLMITAHDASGATITPTSYVNGTVSAVQTIDGATQLTIGSRLVPLTSVIGVNQAAN
jgi:flagellar basal-body rod modification protein FlgD